MTTWLLIFDDGTQRSYLGRKDCLAEQVRFNNEEWLQGAVNTTIQVAAYYPDHQEFAHA